jgi:hypothetical protein
MGAIPGILMDIQAITFTVIGDGAVPAMAIII